MPARYHTGGMSEFGFVFSGCACRMAFAVGVAARLHKAGVRMDLCAGASSGSLVAAAAVAGRASDMLEFFARSGSRVSLAGRSIVSWRRVLHNRSPFDMSTIVRSSLETFFGNGDLRDAPGEAFCTATRFPDLRLRVFSTRHETNFIEPMLGSCFFPVFYGRPIKWRGEWLLDGGILENVPMQPLVDAGVKHLIVVVPNADGRARRSIRDAAWRPTHATTPVTIIAPLRPLRLQSWELDADKLAESIAAGTESAERFLRSLEHGSLDESLVASIG